MAALASRYRHDWPLQTLFVHGQKLRSTLQVFSLSSLDAGAGRRSAR